MIGFVVSLAATAGITASVLPVLRQWLPDHPNNRSSHVSPKPRGGGLAVLGGVILGVSASAATGGHVAIDVIVPALILGAIGLVDDLKSLGGLVRLVFQFGAVIVMVGWVLTDQLHPQFGAVVVIAVVVVCVGYVNAFNFMDGVNGISGLNATVCGAWFAFLGHDLHQQELVVLGLVVAGASLGFLPFNAPSAQLFLGDVGSYGLGLLIAGMAVVAYVEGASLSLVLAPALVYVADTGWVLIKRAAGGRPLMEAHREHVYQRLVDALGWSHVRAAGFTAALALAMCCLAWTRFRTGLGVPVFLTGAILLGLYLAAPAVHRTRTNTP